MIKQEEVVKIGRFAKPHGVKGEISLITESDVFEESEDPYIVCDIDGILVPFFIEEYRYKSNSVTLVKLECVDSEESAREFTGRDVYYPLEDMPEEDHITDVTWDSFIGYSVTDVEHGLLGEVTRVDESTMNVLMHIDYQGTELLFPAAEELIVDVDHPHKKITVALPAGLLEL